MTALDQRERKIHKIHELDVSRVRSGAPLPTPLLRPNERENKTCLKLLLLYNVKYNEYTTHVI